MPDPLPGALRHLDYPAQRDAMPRWSSQDGQYLCRLAQDPTELEEILRLRYRVFNLELEEGLDESHATGLDLDEFDAQCHHLLVEHLPTGRVIGTYRLQTHEMALGGAGLYSAGEFHIERWPDELLRQSIECGRACIEEGHRHRRVLLLLWKGLGAYVLHYRKRYFFGCCSLTSQDPAEAARTLEYLRRHDYLHPTLDLEPRAEFDCGEGHHGAEGWESVRVPTLFRTYLRYGAKIVGRPALDRQFKTIDFLALLDLDELDPIRILRQFEVDLSRRS